MNREKQREDNKKVILPVMDSTKKSQPLVFRSQCCCTRNRVNNFFLIDNNELELIKFLYKYDKAISSHDL